MKIIIRSIVLTIAVLFAGCSAMQPSSNMTAEQITAAGKDKNAMVVCSKIVGMWGTAENITITLDQNSIKDGGITADNKGGCNAAISSAAPPRPAVIVAPKEPAK